MYDVPKIASLHTRVSSPTNFWYWWSMPDRFYSFLWVDEQFWFCTAEAGQQKRQGITWTCLVLSLSSTIRCIPVMVSFIISYRGWLCETLCHVNDLCCIWAQVPDRWQWPPHALASDLLYQFTNSASLWARRTRLDLKYVALRSVVNSERLFLVCSS